MRPARLAPLLLPVALLAAGCTSDAPAPVAVATASAPTPAPAATTLSADQVPAGTVSATYPGPEPGGSTVRLQALPLVVSGRLATLTVLWTPDFPRSAPTERINLYSMNADQPVYVSLVDPVGLKRYDVVEDSSGRDLSSEEVGTRTVSGSPIASRYTFAAPPDGVTAVDVYVGNFPPLADVPVQR